MVEPEPIDRYYNIYCDSNMPAPIKENNRTEEKQEPSMQGKKNQKRDPHQWGWDGPHGTQHRRKRTDQHEMSRKTNKI